MKVVGLIAEYNPFHNGHLYHLEEAKKITKADFVVVIMSGNFMQRGEPAILNKWARAKTALQSGADIVIELPVVFATSSAEFFATASIKLLNDLGIVDHYCFGSESGDLVKLDKVASILYSEPNEYKALLSKYLSKGVNFPSARESALTEYTTHSTSSVLKTSNNILGVEYMKAAKRTKCHIKPHTIKRVGVDYHDQKITGEIASASGIRNAIKNESSIDVIKRHVPFATYQAINNGFTSKHMPIFYDDYFTLLKYTLLKKNTESISQILDITEGLENRFQNNINDAHNMTEFIDLISTKRYTKTKLQRAIVHILLDITKADFKKFIINGYSQYIRVLGFRTSASPMMKALKLHSKLPLIVNVSHSINQLTSLQRLMLDKEILSTEIYNTVIADKFGTKMPNDFTNQIIKIL